jgi:cell division protein FtsQ
VAARRQSRPRTRAAVVHLPSRTGGGLGRWLARLLPSGRSLLVGFALLGVAAGAYEIARSTSLFAIQRVEVVGAPPEAAARIRSALKPVAGTSLVTLEPDAVEERVAALSEVASVSFDRSFPHTLVVTVRLEEPAVVVRRGEESWLVSLRGRVVRPLEPGARSGLPRVWVAPATRLTAGGYVGDPAAERAIRAVAALRVEPLPTAVRSVRGERGELAFRLVSGLELRLGTEVDLGLKLAVAARILSDLPPRWQGGPTTLDVSVPERPVAVATLNSEVELET